MKYTVITKNGIRDIVKNVNYVFVSETHVELVDDEGVVLEAYAKDDIIILTKFV